jgi:hypothetical protein
MSIVNKNESPLTAHEQEVKDAMDEVVDILHKKKIKFALFCMTHNEDEEEDQCGLHTHVCGQVPLVFVEGIARITAESLAFSRITSSFMDFIDGDDE